MGVNRLTRNAYSIYVSYPRLKLLGFLLFGSLFFSYNITFCSSIRFSYRII